MKWLMASGWIVFALYACTRSEAMPVKLNLIPVPEETPGLEWPGPRCPEPEPCNCKEAGNE